jgi:catechol 2,3-dioxygenase-like lactoylglutathione lyase family enzyme
MNRMIGRLETVVVDCPDPRALGRFYCHLLGMHPVEDSDDWVTIKTDSDAPGLSFQRATDFRPPQWPDPAGPQQFHLDVHVDDVDVAEERALAAGATRIEAGGGKNFRVYADPAGHPFCLVW